MEDLVIGWAGGEDKWIVQGGALCIVRLVAAICRDWVPGAFLFRSSPPPETKFRGNGHCLITFLILFVVATSLYLLLDATALFMLLVR